MEDNKIMEQKYVKTMLEKNLFAVVFPKDKSEESALKVVDMVDSAVGIAQFKDEGGDVVYGVLIDKILEAKKNMKLKSTDEEKKS